MDATNNTDNTWLVDPSCASSMDESSMDESSAMPSRRSATSMTMTIVSTMNDAFESNSKDQEVHAASNAEHQMELERRRLRRERR